MVEEVTELMGDYCRQPEALEVVVAAAAFPNRDKHLPWLPIAVVADAVVFVADHPVHRR